MTQTQVTTTAASIPSIILTIFVALIAWHWVESGAGFGTGIKMAWQDAKVGVSCRDIDTTARFIGRAHEDFILDKPLFRVPGWKHFICPVYMEESLRQEAYRAAVTKRVLTQLKANGGPAYTRVTEWIGFNPTFEAYGVVFKTFLKI